jgi:short subunit fatty acids transporter
MNHFNGLILGITVIAGIWSGHVLVRQIEFTTSDLRVPVILFFMVGILLACLSLVIQSDILSGVLGILGIILFWNGIEIRHQEKRVRKGHAPANQANPRHQRILMEYPEATTENLLKHDHSIRGAG